MIRVMVGGGWLRGGLLGRTVDDKRESRCGETGKRKMLFIHMCSGFLDK